MPNEPVRDEENLLRRIAAGDHEAWRDFFDRYEDLIYTCVYYTLRRCKPQASQDDAGDAVHEIILLLMENDGRRLLTFTGRHGCSLATWLRTVAVRHVYWVLRRDGRRRGPSLEDISESELAEGVEAWGHSTPTAPDVAAEESERFAQLREALTGLPGRERLVFELYYRYERSRREIAEFLSTSENNVDQILFRLRKHLRELMEAREDVR